MEREDNIKITFSFYVTSQRENSDGMLGQYLQVTYGRWLNAQEGSGP